MFVHPDGKARGGTNETRGPIVKCVIASSRMGILTEKIPPAVKLGLDPSIR
jgi:hypothetical protein